MDELFNPDTGLFSGSDLDSDGPFDPLRPVIRHPRASTSGDATETIGDDGDIDTAVVYDYPDGFRRYGPSSGEGSSRLTPDDDRSVPWEGAGDQPILGAEERRAREGADTGNRNVRRVAEERSGGTGTGNSGVGTKTHSARVDSSIAAASERIRADLRVPLDARERSAAVVAWESDYDRDRKLQRFTRNAVTAVPQFGNTTFEAMVTGLKANANGTWVLTLQVDPDAAGLIFPLHSAFGLALDVAITRHRHGSHDDDVRT